MVEKSMNVNIVDTKQSILNILVNSKLPSVVCSMIIQDLERDITRQAQQAVNNETRLYNEQVQKESDNLKKEQELATKESKITKDKSPKNTPKA